MASKARAKTTNKKQARDRRMLTRARKQDGEKPLPAGRIAKAAERAGVVRKQSPDDLIQVKRWQLEQALSDLAHAQKAAIEGAIDARYRDGGPHRAIDAYREIESVRKRLADVMIGGAS